MNLPYFKIRIPKNIYIPFATARDFKNIRKTNGNALIQNEEKRGGINLITICIVEQVSCIFGEKVLANR